MATERLRLLFCDHLNLARGKYLPASKIGDGSSRFAQATFALTYGKDLIPAPGTKMLQGMPDMDAVYRASDVRPGWEPSTSVVIADLFESEGDALPMCGRGLLRRTVQQWQSLGLTPKVGLELEAYVFQRDAAGQIVPYETPGAYVYSTGTLFDPRRFTDLVWDRAARMGLNIECLTAEFDSPQLEFTLVYGDALRAVDDAFLFRLLARETALENGLLLTFMPKPILSKGGSGLHVNFSFNDATGHNVIADGAGKQLSPIASAAVAGLMRHHAAMAGVVAPTVNSYQRLKPGSMSGYWRNWAVDHRGVTTRISAQGGKRARIEHRMGDAAANPYVLVASVLQAALLGLTGKYDLPPAETGDCLGHTDATDGVALDLGGALDALEADKAFSAAIGDTLVANHVAIKRAEIKETDALEGDALRDYYIHYI
jgi:glutamine synthetase